MEELVYAKIIEILTRMESKIDRIDERLEKVEDHMDQEEYQRYIGGAR